MSEDASPPPSSELSKVPSWILLGFVLGALFVFLLRKKPDALALSGEGGAAASVPELARYEKPEREVVASARLSMSGAGAEDRLPSPTVAPAAATPHRLDYGAIEALWVRYERHAVWDDQLTEVAFWNPSTQSYSDCFEVLRQGESVFFRPIPRLTRPVVERGLGSGSPIQFTGPALRGTREK